MMPALANHLWQSSLFALGASALAVMLHRNSASHRYRIWLAASIKFLIPFSLLSGIGRLFPTPARKAIVLHADAIATFSRPFESYGTVPNASHFTPEQFALSGLIVPVLAGIWLCGTLGFAVRRCLQLSRIRRMVRQSPFLSEGREPDLLKKILPSGGLSLPIVPCATSSEPGVFGIFRPVLLLPRHIGDRLSDSELEGIFIHEISHVKRRDNLSALLHAIVEAIFWFHPMVWWIGGRLIRERERACDESTLQSGCKPRSYASAILKVCELCVPSAPVLIAGIAGPELRQRIEEIMNYRNHPDISLAKKALLLGSMTIAIGGPILFGLASGQVEAKAPQVVALVRTTAGPFSSPAILPQGQRGQQPPRQNPQPAPAPTVIVPSEVSDLANWMDSEVRLIATDSEILAFKSLKIDEERRIFVANFWTRRDPTPATAENEFKTEFYERVAYANDHFGSADVPGSKSDRGKMYMLFGPPDEIVSHPTGGTYYRPAGQGGGVTNTFPFETWRYRHLDGKGDYLIYEFVDQTLNGNYRLEYDPAAKDNPLAGPTQ